jgi:hypothetical protein
MNGKLTATKMTFVLGVICLAMLGYAAIAFIHLSFHQVPAEPSIPYFIVRQRTALSALAMTMAISCVIMGFAAFMIGAKGEVNFKAESSAAKGALVSGVPGPFFVLCGTVIALTVLLTRVSHEESLAPAAGGAPMVGATGGKSPQISRTIASSAQRAALFTSNATVYNQLMTATVTAGRESQQAVNFLIMHQDDIYLVAIEWDEAAKRPVNYEALGWDEQSRKLNVSEGYLFVLEHAGGAESVKAVLQAANRVMTNFPADQIPVDRLTRILKSAMSSRKVFVRGEPAS